VKFHGTIVATLFVEKNLNQEKNLWRKFLLILQDALWIDIDKFKGLQHLLGATAPLTTFQSLTW